ncbi:hypothetical protein C8R45DRAFT_1174387 [Mycena sanguinolenta]|nr:hypothetical protein C8R45DRAFT_1174387 [Mycena sanguinolenta]
MSSRSTALLLSDLAPDVIFSIFACCDISSVVSISQTCRYLHDLAFDKSVWLGLLDNLRRKSILDRCCSLETLSTDEMIGLVRHIITGPQTWSPLDPEGVAEVSREITLHPTPSEDEYVAELLPSGRYVLFTDWTALGCWSVADDELVWRHTPAIDSEHFGIEAFAAEEMEGSAVIMVCVRTHPPNGDPINYVEMIDVDFRTGAHSRLLAARAPGPAFGIRFARPVLRGELAAVELGQDTFMVVNWRTQSYFILQHQNLPIALLPHHIMLMTDSNSLARQQIHLIANETLHVYWAPTIRVGLEGPAEFCPVSAEDIPKLAIFEHADEQSGDEMYVYENPIQDGDYRVWIRGASDAANLSCYSLSIPTNGQPGWRLKNRSTVLSAMRLPVPYSGHSPDYRHTWKWAVIPPRSSSENLARLNWQFSRAKIIDVASYSGALVYSTSSIIGVTLQGFGLGLGPEVCCAEDPQGAAQSLAATVAHP